MASPTDSYITEKHPDSTFAVLLGVFAARCAELQEELGLSPEELLEIQDAAESNRKGLQRWVHAVGQAQAAQVQKQKRQRAARAVVSKYAKIFRADERIPDSVLGGLMVAPHNPTRPKCPVHEVSELTASADGQGFVTLRWKANGNKPRTTYQIQKRCALSGEWTLLGSTSKTKFSHRAEPGVCISFRVVATRADRSSLPSGSVVLWSDSPALRLAA